MSVARVFVYVQHLLGVGHLKRAATLSRALAAEGLEVTLASGGMPVPEIVPPGVHFVQLPPASAADLGFRKLLDEHGRDIGDEWRRRRVAELLAAWRRADPQVIVLELYPFGRRQMRFELLPLLEAAVAAPCRPVVVCSVRDILGARKSAEREDEVVRMIERYFDHVLVHGDSSVIPFERTFPPAPRIAGKLEYTGYIVDARAGKDGDEGAGDVLVSAGGGAVGAGLLEAAMLARPMTSLRDRRWRLLAGNNLDASAYERLAALAARDRGVLLERSRGDFNSLLANCELSISQAGYNTLLEVVQARARAVVVPFAGGRETEQTLRASCFAAKGLVEMVEESGLAPDTLAAAVERAAGRPRPAATGVSLDGARRSAKLVSGWARQRKA